MGVLLLHLNKKSSEGESSLSSEGESSLSEEEPPLRKVTISDKDLNKVLPVRIC